MSDYIDEYSMADAVERAVYKGIIVALIMKHGPQMVSRELFGEAASREVIVEPTDSGMLSIDIEST